MPKFYLCKPKDAPPQLAPTQADAKALDPTFNLHQVPDDKPGLMAYVNDLFAKAWDNKPPLMAVSPDGDVEFEPEDEDGPDLYPQQRVAPPVPMVAKGRGAPAPNPPINTVDILNRTAIEEALYLSEEHGLTVLEAAIANRRAELAAKAEPTITAPPRRRKAAA